jgi:hypothetical protein
VVEPGLDLSAEDTEVYVGGGAPAHQKVTTPERCGVGLCTLSRRSGTLARLIDEAFRGTILAGQRRAPTTAIPDGHQLGTPLISQVRSWTKSRLRSGVAHGQADLRVERVAQ